MLIDVYVVEFLNFVNVVKVLLLDLYKYCFDECVVRNDGVIVYLFEDSVYV